MENRKEGVEYRPIPVSNGFIIALSVIHFAVYVLAGIIVHLLDETIPPWIIPTGSYITELLAMGTHWAGHHHWSKWWFHAHMGHHINDYPPSRFLSEKYQHAKRDNSKAYFLSLVLSPSICCYLTNTFSVKMFLANAWGGVLVLLLADYLHRGMHTNGFYLEKYQWFLKLRSLHYYHHKGDMLKNFAIGDFLLDFFVFGFATN